MQFEILPDIDDTPSIDGALDRSPVSPDWTVRANGEADFPLEVWTEETSSLSIRLSSSLRSIRGKSFDVQRNPSLTGKGEW